MKDIQLLIKKDNSLGKYGNIYPLTYTDAIIDKSSGKTLHEILLSYNMYFLSYTGNTQTTRLKVPSLCRKTGLWITYVKYDKNVYTEWYAGDKIDDNSWLDSSNWRVGNSQLVGDISISSNGNWVINGEETEFKAIGEKGNTPILKIEDNKLLASYNGGTSYIKVSDNPVYTIFRWKGTIGDSQSNNVGNIQASTDLGKTWTDMSEPFINNLHIAKYIGVDESLPTSGVSVGTIYAKGPTYAEDDAAQNNPIYRLWVYAYKEDTLAWQDNGLFTSIAAGISLDLGNSETTTVSLATITREITNLVEKIEELDTYIGFSVELYTNNNTIDKNIYFRKLSTYIIQNKSDNQISFYSVDKLTGELDNNINILVGPSLSTVITPNQDIFRIKGYTLAQIYKVLISRIDNVMSLETNITSITSSISKAGRKTLNVKDILWELGNLDNLGLNSSYLYYARVRTKGYMYVNIGDTFTINPDYISLLIIYYYNGETVNSTSSTLEIVVNTEGKIRILLIPKTDSVTGLDLINYLSFVPYNSGNTTSIECIDSHMAESINLNVLVWENGHISTNGSNSSYDKEHRIRSRMIYAKKGDIISLIRFKKEQYLIFSYNDDKTIKSSSNWIKNNTEIQENGFIRIVMSYENSLDYKDLETLSSRMSYIHNGKYDDYESIEWESGGIAGSDGSNYSSGSSVRTKNIIHVKAGTTLVPYVFGKYLIAYYDNKGNFIKRMPEDNGGQLNDGYYSQNAFEFKEDCNVRIILFWMAASSFYTKEGFENIIPNTTENLPLKFRIIPPEYSIPYYIKNEINKKNKEILELGDMFRATFITDPHEYYYHLAAAVYCAQLNSNVLLVGGDLLSRPQEGVSDAIETVNRHMNILINSKVPCIVTKGNHEMSTEKDDAGLTSPLYNTELWYTQTQKQLRKNNYLYDNNNAKLGYFFVDDEINKVRIICLNLFVTGLHSIGSSQRIWLMNTALDLSDKGEYETDWSVIVLGHSLLLDNVDPDEPTATKEEEWVARVFLAAYNKTKTELPSDKYDGWTAPDFSNIKYLFVAYLCGHSHYDNISTEKDFPHISTTCAHPLENVDKYTRVWDSIDEYAFDVICLDTINRKLILKRIGVGPDREVIY